MKTHEEFTAALDRLYEKLKTIEMDLVAIIKDYKPIEDNYINECYPLDNCIIHTDMNELISEIKLYLTVHPGEIIPADMPARLMRGWCHLGDGTYWVIKISDIAKTNFTPEQREFINIAFSSHDGNMNFCKMLGSTIQPLTNKPVIGFDICEIPSMTQNYFKP